jgi:hypothetical protein
MSVLLILAPAAISLLGATGTGAAVGVAAAATGASALTGLAVLGSTVAGVTVGLAVKHGRRADTLAYQTHFNRSDLLEQCLSNLGYSVDAAGESIAAKSDEIFLIFEGNEVGTLDAIVDKRLPDHFMKGAFEAIYAEYTRLVQVETYVSLLKEARNHGLELESESVGDDNSISLTFLISNENARTDFN